MLSTFSLISNLKSIFIGQANSSKYAFLDGLRSILSFWVLYCHTHMMGAMPLNSKRYGSSTFYQKLPYMYMLEKNPLFIDTFFFIGGKLTYIYPKVRWITRTFKIIQRLIQDIRQQYKYFSIFTPDLTCTLYCMLYWNIHFWYSVQVTSGVNKQKRLIWLTYKLYIIFNPVNRLIALSTAVNKLYMVY